MPRLLLVTAAVLTILQLTATPARAASISYVYTGELFNFCGFGCPDNAPADPVGADYLTATLTFDNPLAPNLTFSDDVLALLTSWSITDGFGSFFISSGTGGSLTDEPLVPFKLATDGAGNIVGWQMYATNSATLAGIVNPSLLVCPADDCGADYYATDFVAVDIFLPGDSQEWDSGVASPDREGTPGTWATQVPEPTMLTLAGLGLAGALVRRRRTQA